MAKAKKKKSQPSKSKPISKIFPIVVFILGFVLYANTLGNGYAFDDSIVITDNQFTQKGFAGIPDLLTKDFFEGLYGKSLELTGGRYRPLSLVSFAIERGIFGDNPLIGHLVNALIYGLCCLFLFHVVARFTSYTSSIPYVTSILFCFHPIHTEVVANIKSRDEILCFLFLMLTIRLFQKFEKISAKKIPGLWSRFVFPGIAC